MARDCRGESQQQACSASEWLLFGGYWISFIPMHLALIVLKCLGRQELGGDNEGVTT